MLKYHDRTAAILNCQPIIREGSLTRIADAERVLGRQLPEAVRELFSIKGIGRRYVDQAGDENLFSILNVTTPTIADREFRDLCLRRDLLPVATDYGEETIWALILDGSPDPPVMCDGGTGGALWQRYTLRTQTLYSVEPGNTSTSSGN